ncbi:MAG: MFS transporter [Planctomycetota bacterium]
MAPWRKTFYAAWLGQVCSITGFWFVMPLLPLYVEALHPQMSDAQLAVWAGWVRAAAALTMAISAPIWGFVADRYGRKPMVLRAMLGGVVVLVLMAFAQNVTQLIVLRMLQGCLTGTVTASVALVSSVTPRERSGRTLGMMSGAVFFGTCIGPFLGGEIAEAYGFLPTFLTAAGVVLAGGLLVGFFADERFEPPPPSKNTHFATVGEILGTAGFAAAIFALFLVRFGNSSFQPIFPYILRDVLGTEEGVKALTGRIIGVAGIAAALSAGLLGRLSDHWGHRRLLIGSVFFAGVTTLFLALARTIPQFYMLRALYGFAAAGIMPSANAIIRHIIHEKHLGKAYGLLASIRGLGWGLGSISGGYLAAGLGLRAPFVFTGVVLFLAAGLVIWRVHPHISGAEEPEEQEEAEEPDVEPVAVPNAPDPTTSD